MVDIGLFGKVMMVGFNVHLPQIRVYRVGSLSRRILMALIDVRKTHPKFGWHFLEMIQIKKGHSRREVSLLSPAWSSLVPKLIHPLL